MKQSKASLKINWLLHLGHLQTPLFHFLTVPGYDKRPVVLSLAEPCNYGNINLFFSLCSKFGFKKQKHGSYLLFFKYFCGNPASYTQMEGNYSSVICSILTCQVFVSLLDRWERDVGSLAAVKLPLPPHCNSKCYGFLCSFKLKTSMSLQLLRVIMVNIINTFFS